MPVCLVVPDYKCPPITYRQNRKTNGNCFDTRSMEPLYFLMNCQVHWKPSMEFQVIFLS